MSLSKFFISKENKIFACHSTKQFFTFVNNRLHLTQRNDRLLLSDGLFTSYECKIANAFSYEFQSNYSYGCGSDSPQSLLHALLSILRTRYLITIQCIYTVTYLGYILMVSRVSKVSDLISFLFDKNCKIVYEFYMVK